MEFLAKLNPFTPAGVEDTENYTPRPNKKSVGFRNNVKVKNFVFANAPSNVKTLNVRNMGLTNNRKNTRKLFSKPSYSTPLTKANTKRNIRNYESKINMERRLNNLRRGNAGRMNMNVASRKNPYGEKFLREKKYPPKMTTWSLGYSNKINNLTRKAYKPISNQAQKEAENWGKKVHLNEVFGY